MMVLSCEGPCEFEATVCWELQNVIISIERTVGPILLLHFLVSTLKASPPPRFEKLFSRFL